MRKHSLCREGNLIHISNASRLPQCSYHPHHGSRENKLGMSCVKATATEREGQGGRTSCGEHEGGHFHCKEGEGHLGVLST